MLQVTPESPAGVRDLADFLRYAKEGTAALADRSVCSDKERERVSRQIASRLQEEGFEVDVQVGSSGFVIDVAVRDPGDPKKRCGKSPLRRAPGAGKGTDCGTARRRKGVDCIRENSRYDMIHNEERFQTGKRRILWSAAALLALIFVLFLIFGLQSEAGPLQGETPPADGEAVRTFTVEETSFQRDGKHIYAKLLLPTLIVSYVLSVILSPVVSQAIGLSDAGAEVGRASSGKD